MTEPTPTKPASYEAKRMAEYLLTHVGGDESEPWQAGHNYAMREAARLVSEQYHLLDYGLTMPCPECGQVGPHKVCGPARAMVECGSDAEDAYTCGSSWLIDQRGVFTTEGES